MTLIKTKSTTSSGRKPSDFRVLLVYPNIQQCALMPYSIGLFTSILRKEGFGVELFDCTFYQNDLNRNYAHYQTAVRSFDWNEKGVVFNSNDMIADFQKKIDEFQPDLLAISVVENTYPVARSMIRSLRKKVPTLWGGVFATFAPEVILRDDVGDYICRGEGEATIVDVCQRLLNDKDITNTPNLWVKKDGKIFKNPMRPVVDLNTLPIPDYDLFEEQAIYRPMQGKIWRTVGIESQRGCPFTCTYCNSPSNNAITKSETNSRFYRKKSLEKVHEEISVLKKRHNIELIYWLVDTFLALSDKEYDEFLNMYLDFKIPFWMNTRAETVNEYRAEGLERMNCLRMSIGIEHGNAEYRETMLKRHVSNEKMLAAFRAVSGRKYIANGNSIIGMPEENRGLIFDTINFCRQLPKDVEYTGAFIFAPYWGTPLREIAVSKGYLPADTICDIQDPTVSMLDQPQLRRSELLGLARTFGFYQALPKSEWHRIEQAEQNTVQGREIFESLQNEYQQLNAAARLDEGVRPVV